MTQAREPSIRRFARRAVRHVRWAREQGVGRLIEEDELDPFQRISLSVRKARWRRVHRVAPCAMPVFLVGVQRSGTNMVVRGLERSPEFEVFNENSRRAFDRFRLRSDVRVRRLVLQSGHRYVLFKPLCDSHRVAKLLDTLGTPVHGRAIWVYRSVDGRVRSAVAKFGSSNLSALRLIATGEGQGLWQAGGLTDERVELLQGFDYARMTEQTAAALFWYIRNSLFFDLALHERDDVILVSYDRFLQEPVAEMRRLCSFLGCTYEPGLVGHVSPSRGSGLRAVAIDPVVRALCSDLASRLDHARLEERWC